MRMRPQQKHVAASFQAILTYDLVANTSENIRRVAESQLLSPPIEGLMLSAHVPPAQNMLQPCVKTMTLRP
jgi:hypothetical protein